MTGLALLMALQTVTAGPPGIQPSTARSLHDYPFAVGERFEYDAKLGLLKLGTGYMEVTGIDTLRGVETFRFEFGLEGGGLGFRINDRLESWTTTADLVSLRFSKELVERKRVRKQTFEIFPDSGYYREVEKDRLRPTPENPLDDTALFYFMRITPLEVGKTYEYNRYYRDDKNPLVVKVEKREKLKLPDGRKVDCLVLRPVIGDKGMFAERANARLWLTDDARRIPVQIRSRFPFGTITLKLRKMILPERTSSTSP